MDGDRNSEETNPIPASQPVADPYLDVVRASSEAVVSMAGCLRAVEKSIDECSVDTTKAIDELRSEIRILAGAVDRHATAMERDAVERGRIAAAEEERTEIARKAADEAEAARGRRWEAVVSFVRSVFSNPYATLPLGALFLGLAQVIAQWFGIDVGGLLNVPE